MSKTDELKSKNENLFERNTILLNENERLKKENADLRDNYDQFKATAEPEIERLREHNSYMFDTIALKSQQIEKLEKENAELKAGRPQWHDLRKDPNDLPNGYRVVLNQVGMATQYDPNRGFLGFGGAGIIAWCEIPTFDKE